MLDVSAAKEDGEKSYNECRRGKVDAITVGADIAEVVVATSRTSVKLDTFAYCDAAVLAAIRAIALQRPKLLDAR
jgi:hypothetical protein